MSMKKKVLLMGKSGSGKTSMRSIIFSNYIARDTRRLGATLDVEHSHVRFLGNLVLNLWDCGGQEAFMENYFTSQRDHIFRNVEVLIYVFDVESRDIEKDLQYFQTCLEAMAVNSQEAKVFTLIHKMDLVQEDLRDQIFAERVQALRARSQNIHIEAFRTSIWDETLYQAWSSIVYTLVPNVSLLETHLGRFSSLCEADEVVLFERTTFLVISHTTPPPPLTDSQATSNSNGGTPQRRHHPDLHRFEKISNIIKQFKQSCTKSQVQFKTMEFRHPTFTAFIDVLTPNTYVLLVMADPSIQSAATLMNIRMARAHFEKLEANQLK